MIMRLKQFAWRIFAKFNHQKRKDKMKTKTEVIEEMEGLRQKLARLHAQESEAISRLATLEEALEGAKDDQLIDV